MANSSSAYFNNIVTTAVVDHAAEVLRICQAPGFPTTGTDACAPFSSPSPFSTYQSEAVTPGTIQDFTTAHDDNAGSPLLPVKQLRVPGKKSKVPRPPNAFILYRQKHHPILKAQQPHLVNNQISVVLGKQWKQESGQEKAHFKALAEKMKMQHAAENPGYQYAPRRPSEKKRRITAKKLAKLRATRSGSDTQSTSEIDIMDVTSPEDTGYALPATSEIGGREVNDAAAFQLPVSAAEDLEMERAGIPSRIKHHRDDDMSLTMPVGHDLVEHDYEIKMGGNQHPVPFDNMLLRGQIGYQQTSHSANASDFMSSLIDWDAFQADADIIKLSVQEDMEEATVTESGESQLRLSTDNEQSAFQQELDRILWMLE